METQIILECIIIVIGLYLAFFKSYFQEKGKNLATREDISEITQKVESIKNDLMYSTQSKISLKTEERNALVSCYEKYDFWLNASFDTYFGGITKDNYSRLQEIEDKLEDAKLQFELASSRMELFVNNQDITKVLQKLRMKTLELHHLSGKHSIDLEEIFIEMSSISTTIPEEEYQAEIKALYSKRRELSENLSNSKIALYEIIVPIHGELQAFIYNHLQDLLEID